MARMFLLPLLDDDAFFPASSSEIRKEKEQKEKTRSHAVKGSAWREVYAIARGSGLSDELATTDQGMGGDSNTNKLVTVLMALLWKERGQGRITVPGSRCPG